jgi:hypothetical protein
MLNDNIYEYLFALRLSLQDTYTNETDIIRELKLYLINSNYTYLPTNINLVLFNFYMYYDIDISLETIENVSVNQYLFYNNIINLFNNNNNNNNNYDAHINNITTPINNPDTPPINNPESAPANTPEAIDSDDAVQESPLGDINNPFVMLNLVFNLLNHTNTFEDVIVTTNDEDIKSLNKKILDANLELDCTICLENMKKDETITELNCLHAFHSNCIETYLSQYNHKCPICRSEIGRSHYNL